MISEDEANEAWSKASNNEILYTSWGFYSYGDAPPAVGGGVGCFLWFPNYNFMLDFIQSVLPVSPPGPAANDHDMTAQEVARILATVRASGALLDEKREQLNWALKGYSQIEWWGTFRTLLSGDEPFVSDIRKSFREDVEKLKNVNEPRAQIADDEINDFRDYLESYGI